MKWTPKKIGRNGLLLAVPAILIALSMLSLSFSSPVDHNSFSTLGNGMTATNTGSTYSVTMTPNGYEVTYHESSGVVHVNVINKGDGNIVYSVNSGPWQYFNGSTIVSEAQKLNSASASASVSHSTVNDPVTASTSLAAVPSISTFWWYNTNFEQGYPELYPHPDYSYYSIYTQYNWQRITDGIWNQQIGSFIAGPLKWTGAVGIGASIGAFLGVDIGGPLGAAVGAAVGAIIAGILVITANFLAFDAAGSVWFWANSGFHHALKNIPWWVWLGTVAGVAAWLWGNANYFRIGNYTFYNTAGTNNP